MFNQSQQRPVFNILDQMQLNIFSHSQISLIETIDPKTVTVELWKNLL